MAESYTVVIPAHNEERHLADTLRSVLAQTLPPDEVVVVDDGSSDGTAAIARDFGVRVIAQATARGPSASRNAAIAMAGTSLVAFLDADDLWLPGHAATLMAAFSDSRTVFAGSCVEMFGTETAIPPMPFEASGPRDIRDHLIRSNPVVQSTAFVRRNALERVGGYDETIRLSEDYELWTRVADLGAFAFTREITVRRRMHVSQASSRFRVDLVRAWWHVRRGMVVRRLAAAGDVERRRVLDLLLESARDDIEMAIWSGNHSMLATVRDELDRTDRDLSLSGQLSGVGGAAARMRRVSQDLRCRVRAVHGALRSRR